MSVEMHYIHYPVVTMREHPSTDSKVVSQALFAEPIQIIKRETDSWANIVTPMVIMDGSRRTP